MEPTMLTDGRRVLAEPCMQLETALTQEPRIFEDRGNWYIDCCCCEGRGEHAWSPSGHGVDPDGGHYGCGPCCGTGRFKIQMP